MSREFKLPELGEGVEAGDVLKVLVGVGDAVDADQPVVELETDKAVEHYRKALAVQPDLTEAKRNLERLTTSSGSDTS